MRIYPPMYQSCVHVFVLFVMDGVFILLLISDWGDLQGILIGNRFKLSGQLAIYFSHRTSPIAGYFMLRNHLYCFHHTIAVNTN